MKQYNITVNGTTYQVDVEEIGGSTTTVSAPKAAPVAAAPVAAPAAVTPSAGATPVNAPIPGKVLDIKVSAGQQVAEGDILVILEAMKMENEILAPKAGVVDAIAAEKGSTVNSGDLLVTLK